MSTDKPKPKRHTPPFTYGDENKISQAIAKLHGTQVGAFKETFTVDDLRLLFVPHEHRAPLNFVYKVETDFKARGDIYFDVAAFGGPIQCDTMDGQQTLIIDKAIFQMTFRRAFAPEGFITPESLFGTRTKPLVMLQVAPENLRLRFIDNLVLLAKTSADWTLVKWVFDSLQKSLRTPQQMRYVWPAIYPLSTAAQLDIDLTFPSSRAGVNAVPASDIRPYLRDSNDIVARSTLMGVNDEYLQDFAREDLKLVYLQLRLNNRSIEYTSG